ncbi:MAG: transposase [Magnetococcales bacterium]|nr:transposase [Magnetococcales bacterium]
MANQSAFKAMGIETVISAPASPLQNSFCERFGGSLCRECLNHFIVLNEAHLRQIISTYRDYYHKSRTHIGLGKDCPISRPVQINGSNEIISTPVLGRLHHHYSRMAC